MFADCYWKVMRESPGLAYKWQAKW